MALTSSQISTSNTQIFAASGDQAITTVIFCNTDVVSSVQINVFAVGNGNVVSTATQILKNLTLPPTETFVLDAEKFILGNGDALYAQSSLNNVVCATVSSVSI